MKTKKNILPITYNNFIEGSICIDDYKLVELKNKVILNNAECGYLFEILIMELPF